MFSANGSLNRQLRQNGCPWRWTEGKVEIDGEIEREGVRGE